MRARTNAKRKVLQLIARHDGEWYWYQIDQTLSGTSPDCIGPFKAEINELETEGLIEIRNTPNLPGGVRYWITATGKASLAAAEKS